MKQCTVVLVDDDNDDMLFLKEALEETGKFSIVASCNAKECLVDVLQKVSELPDLIICDLNMPTKSGIEVHNDLRSLDSFAEIPFVLVSGAVPSPTLEVKAEKEGLSTVLLKPMSESGYRDLCIHLYDIIAEKRA